MRDLPARPLIVSVDQSTSATKALIFDSSAAVVARSSMEHRQLYPQAGWVEHDPEELYANTVSVVKEAARTLGAEKGRVCALTLTNQRETAVVWDRAPESRFTTRLSGRIKEAPSCANA